MAGIKSTNAEKEAIIQDIRDQWTKGKTKRAYILKYIGEKYSKCENQIDNYISDLNALLREQGKIDSEKTRQTLLDRYDMLFDMALSKEDYKACAYINSKISEIGGVRHETHTFVTQEVSDLLDKLNSIK